MHIARRVMNVDPLVSFEGAVKCGVQFTEMGGAEGGRQGDSPSIQIQLKQAIH